MFDTSDMCIETSKQGKAMIHKITTLVLITLLGSVMFATYWQAGTARNDWALYFIAVIIILAAGLGGTVTLVSIIKELGNGEENQGK